MSGINSDKLHRVIDDALRSRKLCKEKLVSILELAREMYNLDCIFVATNKEYRYQLKQVILCERTGTKINQGNVLELTKKQYEEIVEEFRRNPICENSGTVFGKKEQGCALHGAIMQGDNFYGMIAFCSDGEREWCKEEKEIMNTLSYLLLISFGLDLLRDGLLRYEQEKQKFENETISSGFFLDIRSGKCHAVKLAPFLQKRVREWEHYDELLKTYIDQYVDPVYGQRIQDSCSLEALKTGLSLQRTEISVDFPRVVDGKVSWFQYVVELIDCDGDGIPGKAYFFFCDITDDMQNNAYISSISEMKRNAYVVISSIDLETEQYAVYVDNRTESVRDTEFLSYGGYRDLIDKMAEVAIEPLYAQQFKDIFSLDNLREHFEHSQDLLRYEFPYKINRDTYWVKLEAIKTQKYDHNGKKIVLYFSDITDQKNKEIQLMTVSHNLEKEHERVREAELQAMIDPMTGVYNRAGFEYMLRQYRDETVPIGFVLLDVDNFKLMNDTYGHEFGDQVLLLLAKRLQVSFRNKDTVFRLGGDEFGLLLYGCGHDACKSLQMKFSNIHHYLREVVKKDIAVTISVGFCQSDSGYQEGLLTLADEALYHTKSTGRAGMTQIDQAHQILYSWHDQEFVDQKNAIPQAAVLGNWRLEFDPRREIKKRLFLDETAHMIFEIPNTLTPEECFEFWYARIAARHYELYDEMWEKLYADGQAECTYNWAHPQKGEIVLHTGVKYRSNEVTGELFGYVRELKKTNVVLSYDDGQFLMKAMNRIYFCTYYFNLLSKNYYIIKGHENEPDVKEKHKHIDVTFRKFVTDFVHPEFQQTVAEFSDLNTLSERLKDKAYIECDYLSSSKAGWCRTRIMPVKWDAQGNLTHAMSMSTCIDAVKKAELQKEEAVRKAMKMQLRVSEILSKTSIAQTGLIDKENGTAQIWLNAVFTDKKIMSSFDEIKAWGHQNVCERDLIFYEENFTLQHILEEVNRKGYYEMSYRRINEQGEIATVILHFENLQFDDTQLLMVIEDVSDRIPKGIEWIQQFEILEKVNESIAIFDYETYDIVFMNKLGRDRVGMDLQTVRTKKCYDLFEDRDESCIRCRAHNSAESDNGFIYKEMKGSNKSFLIHRSVMEINGKKYWIEQAVPAAEIDSSIEHLRKLLNTEEKLMSCVQKLITIQKPDEAIDYLLDQIIEYYDCDRANLSVLTGEHQGTILKERCNEGRRQKFYTGQVLTLTDFMQWDRVYSPINLRKVYCEGSESAQQKWMREEGLDNLMILSFEYGNEKIGYISIDAIRRHKSDENWIGTLAFFIANELSKYEK